MGLVEYSAPLEKQYVRCFGWDNETHEFYVPLKFYLECDGTCRHDGPKRKYCGARTEVIYHPFGIVVAAFAPDFVLMLRLYLLLLLLLLMMM